MEIAESNGEAVEKHLQGKRRIRKFLFRKSAAIDRSKKVVFSLSGIQYAGIRALQACKVNSR
jgi:hypothetical protein